MDVITYSCHTPVPLTVEHSEIDTNLEEIAENLIVGHLFNTISIATNNKAPEIFHCVNSQTRLIIRDTRVVPVEPLSEYSLRWRHNERDSVSNHHPHDCLLSRLFRRRSKKTSKLRVTGLCAGNSPETGEFPAQMASNSENVSIWWRHHVSCLSEVSENR